MREGYDTILLIVPNDFTRMQPLFHKLRENLESERICFIGPDAVGELLRKSGMDADYAFLNENTLLPFDAVNDIMKDILQVEEIPHRVTGWYYQQFLKLQYAYHTEHPYYLAWDGDTVPIRKISMFCEDTPYFDWKREYEERYFQTLAKLFPGMHKVVAGSFISEHMLFRTEYVREMLLEIEGAAHLAGETFYERILRAIGREGILSNSFSEFETYGTYTALRHTDAYRMRRWFSYRNCGQYFRPEDIREKEMEWLSRDFHAISFEKGHSPEPGYEFFRNSRIQDKLSARQLVEIIQEEITNDSYRESWD